jgi:uncharacterized protein YndB with AHSA1/START domain
MEAQMTENQKLKFTQTINAPAKQVYDAFTSSVALQAWFADFAEADASENGRFYAWWNTGYYTSGKFSKVEEGKQITFSWQGLGEPGKTKVSIALEEEDGKTQVTIKHRGVGTTDAWADATKEIKQGWEIALENLKSVIETGLDKRVFDIPMLGVIPSEVIDEKRAEELNLPISTGIRIGGVVEGLGAEAAGMQSEDVIYSLNKQILKRYPDFATALRGKKVGETVEVVYYRASEEQTTDMLLSGRPVPKMPASAQELADMTSEIYEQINADIDKLFEKVTDEEASYSAEPDQWSAKEVLAHLIFTERYQHTTMTAAIENYRAGGISNDSGMLTAIANAYPLEDLIAEYKRCEEITVAAVTALPDDFVADKRRFFALTLSLSEQGFPLHTHGHFPQIQAAIEAAKGR